MGSVNLYNTSDALTANRQISGDGFGITFGDAVEPPVDLPYFDVYALSSTLNVEDAFNIYSTGLTSLFSVNTNTIDLNSSNINLAGGVNVLPSSPNPSYFLTIAGAGEGLMEYSTVAEMQTTLGITNLYMANGALVSSRTVDCATFGLSFTNSSIFEIYTDEFVYEGGIVQFQINPGVDFLVRGGAGSEFNIQIPLNFGSPLVPSPNPISLLVIDDTNDRGRVRYITVDDFKTFIGTSLTTGYIAYGTGTGIIGEAEFFYDEANNRLGIGTATPAAILDLTSVTSGFLPPRMTATQASAITPVEGLILYTTDTDLTFTSKGWWGYNGTTWIQL